MGGMTRPLRVDRAGGWYHVTSRGIERRLIASDERCHEHFCELLEAMVQRFRVRVHAYVLMNNHYHLVVETPEGNLSRAIQWLNVSYVAWFNRRANRVGPLMQGRFKAIVVENSEWAYELSLYVHLNPVMRKGLGLDKKGKKAEAKGWRTVSREEAARRLKVLRSYTWSSYRAYAGYAKKPDWLTVTEILGRAPREGARQVATYRKDVRDRLLKGGDTTRAEEIRDAFALGSETFREKIRKLVKGGREVSEPAGLRRKIEWGDILAVVEKVTGERVAEFMGRRGGIGRALALWAARNYGAMTLQEAGKAAGGMDYAAVSISVKRLEQRARKEASLRQKLHQMEPLLNVET